MRVLYAVWAPDTLSETYIQYEREWMEAQGVEIGIWAMMRRSAHYTAPEKNLIIEKPIAEAIREFNPDLIHVHWLSTAAEIIGPAMESGKPITVRGHSFDHTPDLVALFDHMTSVRKVWLYPHLLEPSMSAKVAPLTVSYDAAKFRSESGKKRNWVYRATTGQRGKGNEEYVDIARRCPDLTFKMAVTRMDGDKGYPDQLANPPVSSLEISTNVAHEEVSRMMRQCGLYLRGYDPRPHPYGMPVSVAEAMGSGAVILSSDHPAARSYIGEAGHYYSSVNHAIELLRETQSWSDPKWKDAEDASLARAALYRTDVVLPPVLAEWKRIVGA